MYFMVIEHFKEGQAVPIYQRFDDQGRLAPDGLSYVASWVTEDLSTCYQVMECADPQLLALWMARWSDLVDFEVRPVLTSAQAAEQVCATPGYKRTGGS